MVEVVGALMSLGLMVSGVAAWTGRWRSWASTFYPGRLVLTFPGWGLGTAFITVAFAITPKGAGTAPTPAMVLFMIGLSLMLLSFIASAYLPWHLTPRWYKEWRREESRRRRSIRPR